MKQALTQEQADNLVRQLGLDGEVDDYELVGQWHTYFCTFPYALQIDLGGRARWYDVDVEVDTGRIRSVSGPGDEMSYRLEFDGQPIKLVSVFLNRLA